MNKLESRAALSLSLIFAFRMLGLFMILPVFATYGQHLQFATPTLIGLALGIYGLSQALLQIPFGLLSDKFGRKPLILMGLILFALGSMLAASASSIYMIIIGRAIQGAGAVGSVIIALVADLTSEENRTKAMAMIGITIGFAFVLAMILGPILAAIIHVDGIFWVTAGLAVVGILCLYTVVPNPVHSSVHRDAEAVPVLFKTILKDKELLRLDFGILSLHAILTATFIAIPFSLEDYVGLALPQQWMLYLPVLIVAFIAMLPMIIIAEKKRHMKKMFRLGIGLIAISQLGLWLLHYTIYPMALLLFIFFTAFTFLEASLPSLISKRAPAGSKGTAMGIYSSSQFFGIFLGGLLGGWLFAHFGLTIVFLVCGLWAFVWLAIAFTMQEPTYLSTKSIKLSASSHLTNEEITQQLKAISGVYDVFVLIDQRIAHLKVDTKQLDNDALSRF